MIEDKEQDPQPDSPAQPESGAVAPSKDPPAETLADGAASDACSVCGSTLPADAQKLCPVKTCRAFRKGNSVATKHDGRSKLSAEDLSARDALMNRLFRERGGRGALDIVSQLRVEDYATAQIQLGKVTKRLELVGAVSTAGNKRTSLVDTYNLFSARVERLAQELPPPIASAGTSAMTGDDYALLDDDQLIERTSAILRSLLDARDERRKGEALIAQASADHQAAAGLSVQASTDPAGEVLVPTPVPAPQPACPYCGRACVGVDHPAFEALHWSDPEEVKKRDGLATRTMMRQLGKPLPGWYE